MKTALVFLVILAAGCVETVLPSGQSDYAQYDNNFSIEYPPNWTNNITLAGTFFTGSGDFPPTMRVSTFDETIESAAERAKQLQSRLVGFSIIREENVTVGGSRALRREYRWTDAARNVNFTQVQVWTGKGYLLTATALEQGFSQYAPAFDRMIDSFRTNS